MLKIGLSNFNSFVGDVNFELKPITLFIGANNSGKSTLKNWFGLLGAPDDYFKGRLKINEEIKGGLDKYKNRYSGTDDIKFSIYRNSSIGLLQTDYVFKTSIGKQSLSQINILLEGETIFEWSVKLIAESPICYPQHIFEKLIDVESITIERIDPTLDFDLVEGQLVRDAKTYLYEEEILKIDDEIRFCIKKYLFDNRIPKTYNLGQDHIFKSLFTLEKFFEARNQFDCVNLDNNCNLSQFVNYYNDQDKNIIELVIYKILNIFSLCAGDIVELSNQSKFIRDDIGFKKGYDTASYYMDPIYKPWERAIKSICDSLRIEFKVIQIKGDDEIVYGRRIQVFQRGSWVYLDELGQGLQSLIKSIINLTYLTDNHVSFKFDFALRFHEEPENRLHPDMVIKYADILLKRLNYGHIHIIETHSIHLLRAFQLAVAEGKLSANDIIIYDFAIDDGGINKVQAVEVFESGALSGPFHTGFSDLASDMELKIWEIHNNLVKHN